MPSPWSPTATRPSASVEGPGFTRSVLRAGPTCIRVLRIHDCLNQITAIRFLDYVLEKLPLKAEVIQTDNGAEFQTAFHWHVLDRGIQHVYIKTRTPRLNGNVERSHRIDAEEFYRLLDGVIIHLQRDPQPTPPRLRCGFARCLWRGRARRRPY
jgi:transposase InsO family protein